MERNRRKREGEYDRTQSKRGKEEKYFAIV